MKQQSPAPQSRRHFLQTSAAAAFFATSITSETLGRAPTQAVQPIIDTHMHVWGNDPKRYPFAHPYDPNFKGPAAAGTVEMLIEDMDRHGCTHAVLVQVIFHGWDNTYIADCVERYPQRFKAHGLIDPADMKVAEKLEYWMKERGLAGMRFSPSYYQNGSNGGDDWLTADHTHELWKKAAILGAVFNFLILPPQLPKLEVMVRAHPDVRVIIDHVSYVDLTAADSEADIRRLLALAKYPSVAVKISEFSSLIKTNDYPYRAAYPCIQRVYDAFGPDRLLFGTGYPGTARAAYHRPTLEQEVDIIRREIPFFTADDRSKILGGNAARLWGFPMA
jgi:predicted TIM-barrel fold metal-dependent hydrolase